MADLREFNYCLVSLGKAGQAITLTLSTAPCSSLLVHGPAGLALGGARGDNDVAENAMENACDELCPHMESLIPSQSYQTEANFLSTDEFINFIKTLKEEQERELSISSLNNSDTS